MDEVSLQIGQSFDWIGLAQAIGSVLAIGSGFAVVWYQENRRKDELKDRELELARAAGALAHDSAEVVLGRLVATIEAIDGRTLFALRGHRTTEMVRRPMVKAGGQPTGPGEDDLEALGD